MRIRLLNEGSLSRDFKSREVCCEASFSGRFAAESSILELFADPTIHSAGEMEVYMRVLIALDATLAQESRIWVYCSTFMEVCRRPDHAELGMAGGAPWLGGHTAIVFMASKIESRAGSELGGLQKELLVTDKIHRDTSGCGPIYSCCFGRIWGLRRLVE